MVTDQQVTDQQDVGGGAWDLGFHLDLAGPGRVAPR
jgi:hypothetical protein